MKINFNYIVDILAFGYQSIHFLTEEAKKTFLPEYSQSYRNFWITRFIFELASGKVFSHLRGQIYMGDYLKLEKRIASLILYEHLSTRTHEDVVNSFMCPKMESQYYKDLKSIYGKNNTEEYKLIYEGILVFLDVYNLDEIREGLEIRKWQTE